MTRMDLLAFIHAGRVALDGIEVASADTEPAPVSVLLFRHPETGLTHRACRIEGTEGYATWPGCDLTDCRVIPDLSRVSDEASLHDRCFGPVEVDGG